MTQEIMMTTHVNANGRLVLAGNNMNRFDDSDVEVLIEEDGPESFKYGIAGVQAAKKKAEEDAGDEEEDDEVIDVPDDEEKDEWEEGEEEDDNWDPDFDEFDIPKSTKKGTAGKEDEEEDIKFDEDLNEFDDLFGDAGDGFDDDEDF